MPRKNYKLIAKKQLEKLNNDYEELKIKSQDPYFECDEYICNIADLEHWLEDNGDYRVRYKDYPDLRDTRNIFKDWGSKRDIDNKYAIEWSNDAQWLQMQGILDVNKDYMI